jgi:hypothetical protein
MNIKLYQQYLQQYLKEAIHNSDGTNSGIGSYLSDMKGPGRFSLHATEKARALQDARHAFDEHRHWPLDIIISQLGVDPKEVRGTR